MFAFSVKLFLSPVAQSLLFWASLSFYMPLLDFLSHRVTIMSSSISSTDQLMKTGSIFYFSLYLRLAWRMTHHRCSIKSAEWIYTCKAQSNFLSFRWWLIWFTYFYHRLQGPTWQHSCFITNNSSLNQRLPLSWPPFYTKLLLKLKIYVSFYLLFSQLEVLIIMTHMAKSWHLDFS